LRHHARRLFQVTGHSEGPAPDRLYNLVLVGLALYFAVMAAASAMLVTSGRSDDAESLLLTQSLQWGYESKNPPGFYWLTYLVMQVTGPEPATVYALRMAGVFTMFAGLCAVARRLQPDPMLGLCAGLAMLATIHFHWYLLTYLTNTTLAMALVPLSVLALLRLNDRPDLWSYALLGAVLGLGMLIRYNFAVFAAALVLASLTLPEWRQRLLCRRGLVPLVIVAAMITPHLVWVAAHWRRFSRYVETTIGLGSDASYLSGLIPGLGSLIGAPLEVLAFPLGLLLLVCFPRAFRRVQVEDAGRSLRIALVGRTVLIGLGLMAIYVLAGASHLRPHHLFFLALAPVWLLSRLDPASQPRHAAPTFLAALFVCVVLAGIANLATNLLDSRTCDKCAEFAPMADYAQAARTAGFMPGTILTLARRQDFPAGALRADLPGARIISPEYPLYDPPQGAAGGDCLIVWEGTRDAPEGADILGGAAVPLIGLSLPPGAIVGTAEGTLRQSGRPAGGMRFVLVPGGLGDCR
jgi:4-amino-4-deoxy-L-arabinose transferase-like glycosyltransferase